MAKARLSIPPIAPGFVILPSSQRKAKKGWAGKRRNRRAVNIGADHLADLIDACRKSIGTTKRAEVSNYALSPEEGMNLLPEERAGFTSLRAPDDRVVGVDCGGKAVNSPQCAQVPHSALLPKECARLQKWRIMRIIWIDRRSFRKIGYVPCTIHPIRSAVTPAEHTQILQDASMPAESTWTTGQSHRGSVSAVSANPTTSPCNLAIAIFPDGHCRFINRAPKRREANRCRSIV